MLEKEEILKLLEKHPLNYAQMIKANHKDLYDIVDAYNGRDFMSRLFVYIGKDEYCSCGKLKKLYSIRKGYAGSCGDIECMKISRKKTTLELYKCENVFQIDTVKEKITETNLKNLNVARPAQNPDVLAKMMQTSKDNHDGIHHTQVKECRDKMIQTSKDNHDGIFHSGHPICKEKAKQTMMDRYGEEHYSKTKNFLERMIETNNENYGCDYASQNPEIQKQIKETVFKKYGVENISQKHISPEIFWMINDEEWLRKNADIPVNKLANQLGISAKSIYHVYKKYNIIKTSKESYLETEIREFLETFDIDIIKNSRRIISPLEIDFYIPEYNVAIECNGSYWHSEMNGKDETYHVTKTNMCGQLGIRLVHIWEHVWNDKKEIVKSIITNSLNKSQNIMDDMIVKKIDMPMANMFLNENHIHGEDDSTIRYGMFQSDILVSVMTFTHLKHNEWELSRYCDRIGFIVDGIEKMFDEFVKDMNPVSVIAYSDREYGLDDVYEKLGFEIYQTTEPEYLYTKNYNLFERENSKDWNTMVEEGYDRIWNCGHKVWLKSS